MQLVESGKAHVVFTRWGRTGTAGSCKTEAFADLNEAVSVFATKCALSPPPRPPRPRSGAAPQEYTDTTGSIVDCCISKLT